MLDILLPLDCFPSGGKDLKIDQLMNVISLGMAFDKVIAMLVHAANEIIGHANIQRTAWPAREDTDIELPHGLEPA
jgi:DNA-binding winged helix-turn-helix (wHTH) protein